jgi:hypothetical protein
MEDLAALNRYAVETRYPGEWDPIAGDEAADALAVARRVFERAGALVQRAAISERP